MLVNIFTEHQPTMPCSSTSIRVECEGGGDKKLSTTKSIQQNKSNAKEVVNQQSLQQQLNNHLDWVEDAVVIFFAIVFFLVLGSLWYFFY